jgi:hypothetical protein
MTDSEHIRSVSWQRAALGTGASRDYYDNTDPDQDPDQPKPPAPGSVGRTVKLVGTVIALAGLAGWLWLILAVLAAMGTGNLSDDTLGARFIGIPLGSGGFDAVLLGGLLALGGSVAEKAARRRVHWEPTSPPD